MCLHASRSYMSTTNIDSAAVLVRINTHSHETGSTIMHHGGGHFNADVRIQVVCDNLRGPTHIYSILFTSTYNLVMHLVNLRTLTQKLSFFPFTDSTQAYRSSRGPLLVHDIGIALQEPPSSSLLQKWPILWTPQLHQLSST